MNKQNTLIILVHGFYSDASACHYLARVLTTEHPVYTVDLPLSYLDINTCIVSLKLECERNLLRHPGARLCFVGHSTGGLVIRGLLHSHPEIADRTLAALMVAVPNRGTALADIHENVLPEWMRIHRPIAGITRQATAASDWQCPDHILLMGIAGIKSWRSTRFVFKGLNDGVVPVSSVVLEQMEDLVLLPYDHLQILRNFALAKTILYFLQYLQLPPQLYRMNLMNLEDKFRLIYEKNALDDLIDLERSNIDFATAGGTTFWSTLVEIDGWKLQQHFMTKHLRLLNPSNIRKAWGGKHHMNEIMDTVISKIQASEFVGEQKKDKSDDPIVKRLERLQELFNRGLVSEEEFDKKRSDILSSV